MGRVCVCCNRKGVTFMNLVLLLARLLLAVVFVVAGLTKLVDLAGSRKALRDFGVPAMFVTPFAVLLPLTELAVAVALILNASAWWGAIGALVLLLLFIAAISYNLSRGRTPDCHCFGQLHSAPAGWPTLIRNLVLAAFAGFIVVFGRTNAGASITDWLATLTLAQRIEVGVAALVIALLAVETWTVIRVLHQHGDVLLRLHELETRLAESETKVIRDAPPPPANGLPVGTVAPVFSLPGLYGETITLDYLRARNKPVLLIFSDPGCGPCNAFLPEIARWQRDYTDKLTLALISRGTPEVNRAKTSMHELSHVLLQQDREVAVAYQAPGTPCAVLIDPDGTINSPLACGAELIRALSAQAVGLPVLKTPPGVAANKNGNGLPMAAVPDGNAAAATPSQPSTSQVGEPAPAFTLPGLDGQTVSFSDFRKNQTLVLFWNPDCGFCQQMLADLKAWEAEPPHGAPKLLVVSTGSLERNRALGLRSPVLLDGGFTIGPKFGIHGTPMAVLVDTEGRIASEIAAGAPAVFELAHNSTLSQKPG
jgi:methylamine dehydrogenase accessory protein MauD